MQSRIRTVLFTVVSFICFHFALSVPTYAQVYGIKDLGVLPGQTNSIAYNLNDAGQVVGQSGLYGFLWSGGTMTELILPGGSLSLAQGISPGGAVVGDSHTLNTPTHAFLYNESTMYDLHGRLLGGVQNSSYANSINAWGQIVGGAFTPSDQYHAYILDPLSGHTYDLGTLGGFGSEADSINYRSEVVGYSNLPGGQRHAFFWNVSGGMVDLGSLGGYYKESGAAAINDVTQVVGWSATATSASHAFLRNQQSAMSDLGTLGGATSEALGINNSGVVVGDSVTSTGVTHAFRWIANPIVVSPPIGGTTAAAAPFVSTIFSAYGMHDLNTFLPANSGWELISAHAINNNGQIAGYGLHFGQERAFLMTPIAVQSLTLSPSSIAGGNVSIGTITLNDVTPVDITVSLSNTNSAITAPASVVIPAGASSQTFTLTSAQVTSATSGTVTATYNGSVSAAITVRLPILSGLTLSPSSVLGGTAVTGTVTLDGVTPVAVTVALASNKPTVAAPSVSTLTIPAGSKTAKFTVNTHPVTVNTFVTIAAGTKGVTKSATLLVHPKTILLP